MGAYRYATKPSHTAIADLELADGTIVTDAEVALYHYCYKPSHWDRGMNRRLDFKTGVQACRNAWDRAGRAVPRFGVNVHIEEGGRASEIEPFARPFLTGGNADVMDDYVKYDGARVLCWVKLPKGFVEGPAVERSGTPL